MKTLDEIKLEVLKPLNKNADWEWAVNNYQTGIIDKLWKEVCRRAQLECARETLIEASDKAVTAWIKVSCEYCKGTGIREGGIPYSCTACPHCDDEGNEDNIGVDKSSILDEANIKLIQ